MMNTKPNSLAFPVPLTMDAHQTAQAFYQQHADPIKAKQVYLNTLSVQAVNFYLSCLGIDTNLDQGDSWNPVLQVLSDSADLWIHGVGRVECRPVLPHEIACTIPAQTWSDRIGYLAVQLNADLTEAKILGFVPQVDTEVVSLEAFQSIYDLPDYLDQLTTVDAPVIAESLTDSSSTILSRWLHDWVNAGWETIDTLLAELGGAQPVFSFRHPTSSVNAIEPLDDGIKRGKLLTLGDTPDEQVLFLVGVMPSKTPSEFNIKVELYPIADRPYLPQSLHMTIMDDNHQPVLQADGSNSEGLEFQFSGERGERFSVSVNLNQINLTETFEI